ncbi:nucleotide exchange factor GrpE [candidate division WWE3 bacterium]|nr:nucleotide exchange factor GrpE [candidate division WWE3 bacterium]
MKTKKQDDQNDQDRITDLENNWKRALADYKNLEKRTFEEKEAIITFANSVLILRILPVLDNLKTLQKHFDDPSLKMIIKEFEKILKEEQIEEINALGQTFDHTTMDAIESIECEADDEGKVVEVLQTGYTLKNKVLRPARVKVGGQRKVN